MKIQFIGGPVDGQWCDVSDDAATVYVPIRGTVQPCVSATTGCTDSLKCATYRRTTTIGPEYRPVMVLA